MPACRLAWWKWRGGRGRAGRGGGGPARPAGASMSANKRYGMSIDIDKCNGCGACMMACAVENNIPPAPEAANDRRGVTWIRVYKVDNHLAYPERRTAFVPVLCQQCGHDTPCVHVCPQQAVDVDPETGIVG